jgi:hypothetical protein
VRKPTRWVCARQTDGQIDLHEAQQNATFGRFVDQKKTSAKEQA